MASDAASQELDATKIPNLYGEEYYENYHSGYVGHPYKKGDPVWEGFFGRVADEIVRSLSPRKVFDAGCALGFLVEALWDRGVEARGRDISEFAIGQVRPDVREYCEVGSIAAPIDGTFDLVLCIEVLEHLPEDEARLAIDRMTQATDRILFSSTPTDFDEETHINVRPPIYWLREFASHGFKPVLGYNATFLCPHAMLLERASGDIPDDVLIGGAELVQTRIQLAAKIEQTSRSLRAPVAWLKQRDMEVRYTALIRELQAERTSASAARTELAALHGTKVIRYSRLLRKVYGRLREQPARVRSKVESRARPQVEPQQFRDTTYDLWIREFDTLDDEGRLAIAAHVAAIDDPPLVSVLMPVYNTPERFLRRAIESVLGQLYEHWELCLVDDSSTAAWIPKVLEEYAARDRRVRCRTRSVNGHISAASNTALEMARGEWIVVLDHDDELSEHALAHAVLATAGRPDSVLVYSDEDKIDENGVRSLPFFKPEFDPLLLLAQNYVCHMTMLRRAVVDQAGGFREGMEGSQDWDLVLRVTEGARDDQVVHVPHVLYHWRMHEGSTAIGVAEKPYAIEAGSRAVEEHLQRTGRRGRVITNPVTGLIRVKWDMPESPPKVSIIIPTRDGRYLGRCLESLFRNTEYPDFEVILVDNGSVEQSTFDLFRVHGPWIRVIRDDRPFNYSALNNEAARECTGEVICLLNDDCEIQESDWLQELVSQLGQERVGAVGAKLMYGDGRIQHGGVLLGIGGVAGHAHRLADRLAYGYFGWLYTPRNLSAVTGACMVVRRDLFRALGGLDEENLGISLNDVDFCLRIREAGWRVVWTPFAQMTHHESVSRGTDHHRPFGFGHEFNYIQRRWGPLLSYDPAYNPNLSLETENFDLAFPPRV